MFGRVLGVIGKLLIAAGLLVLGFVAFQLWGTSLETARGQSELTRELAADVGDAADGGDTVAGDGDEADADVMDLDDLNAQLASVDPATAPPTPPPPQGEAVGILTIPRIGLQTVVVEGVSKEDLKKGPGHYPGTPLPGQAGNAGIAGHRTTYGAPFNRIDELVPGDEVTVATPQGEFTYEVIPAPGQETRAWYAVAPSQVEVLADMGDDRITLTACHPKYSARERIIVHAVLRSPPAAAEPVATGTDTDETADEAAAEEDPEATTTAQDFDEGLEGEADALWPAIGFGAAAGLLALAAVVAGRYVRKWPVYVLATPGVLVLVWFGYVHMDRYLPAL